MSGVDVLCSCKKRKCGSLIPACISSTSPSLTHCSAEPLLRVTKHSIDISYSHALAKYLWALLLTEAQRYGTSNSLSDVLDGITFNFYLVKVVLPHIQFG